MDTGLEALATALYVTVDDLLKGTIPRSCHHAHKSVSLR